jgi:hypothetical protein
MEEIKLKSLISSHMQNTNGLKNGKFTFNAITGVAKVDNTQCEIFGFKGSTISYDRVLEKIPGKFHDQFEETVHKKDRIVQTKIITLENGNKIREFYWKKYHPEDYECRTLL